MTTLSRRIVSVLLVLLLAVQMMDMGLRTKPVMVEVEEPKEERPLLVWYTDGDIQDYMEASAKEFSEKSGLEVHTELVSEVDYIESICERSIEEEMTGPDLYVASSALLEKAVLSGLALETGPAEELSGIYSEKAAQAVSYHGMPVAWPFYVETSFLLYNRGYVDFVPETIDEILAYAENFEASGQVEKIFEWNVADVIDDYMFLGAYTDLGGPSGDDKNQVSMKLDKIEECMDYYQSLNSYFAIDADTVTSQAVIRDFIEGKTVFTIANVPMLYEVDKAMAVGELLMRVIDRTEGTEESESFYGVAPLPALTKELDTRGLSVTNSVVVNPYSLNRKAAVSCARFLTEERAGKLCLEAGKLPACRSLASASEEQAAAYGAYEAAAEVPKIMELSNMWLHLEVVLADIWRGADAKEELEQFSALLEGQLGLGGQQAE